MGSHRTVRGPCETVGDGRTVGAILALATCKWTNSPVSVSEVNKLRRIAGHLAPGRVIPLVVYARSGVDAKLAAEHEADPGLLMVVSADDLQP